MTDFALEVARALSQAKSSRPERCGTLVRLVGLRMEARGIMAPIGASCEVIGQDGHIIEAEVVGFNDKTLYLMPLTEPVGISPGASVRIASHLGVLVWVLNFSVESLMAEASHWMANQTSLQNST